TVSTVANQSIDEDGYTDVLAFTVGDAETDASQLTVAASSSNNALVAPGGISLTGTGKDRMLIVTPVSDQSGVARVRLTVTAAAGGTTFTGFDVAVNPLYRAEFASWMRGNVVTKEEEAKPLGAVPDGGALADVANISRIKFSDSTADDGSAYND